MEFRKVVGLCALSGVLVSLTACGGGGGSSSSSTPIDSVVVAGETKAKATYSAQSAPAPIADQASAEEILALAADLPQNFNDEFALDAMFSGLGAGTTSASAPVAVAGVVLAGVTDVQTQTCGNGGTLVIKAVFANENEVSPGDYAIVTATNCGDSLGGVVNGQMAFNVNSATSMTIAFADFNASNSDGTSVALNGAFTLESNENTTTGEVTARFHGNAFAISATVIDDTTGAPVHRDMLLTNFNQQFSMASNGTITYSNDMTVASLSLGANFTVDTTVPFVVAPGASYAHEGEMVITGADNHTIKVTAGTDGTTGAPNVTVSYDLDDVEGYETTVVRTWESI